MDKGTGREEAVGECHVSKHKRKKGVVSGSVRGLRSISESVCMVVGANRSETVGMSKQL